jgi:WD40 repeat protein/tRNA A-37 threonylcarbamoyl transferase component Bud32
MMTDPEPGPPKAPEMPTDQPTIIEVRPDKAGPDAAGDAPPPPDTTFSLHPTVDPGNLPLYRLADYEILAEIGRGGMGVVFKARHVKLNRVVALKMILGGALARADDLQRFNTEAAAAAQLQHPGIVALFEAGTFDNQPYFSMEFVQGSSLSQMAAAGPLPCRRAAAYLERTARAVHYAHNRGIIHRDLKPANVLVDESDQPKITDFGLAKVIQTDSGQTRTGTVIGTPSYMSPEQASASKDLGPPSDIYSLGAILYELITARPPFRGETALATLTMVAEEEAVAPRSIRADIDVDLETICMKCLAKEPARRYASAETLADDLLRYLDGEPITARPLGRIARALVWCRRKPTLAALLAVSAAALVALVCGVFAFAVMQGESASEERRLRSEAERQKTEAETARRLAQERLGAMSWLYYLAEMRQVQHALDAANLDRAQRLLKSWPRSGQLDPRDWEWFYLWNLAQGRFTLPGHTDPLPQQNGRATALAWHPDGWRLASAGGPPAKAAEVKIWDTRTGKLLHTLTGHTNKIGAVAYSPDGQLLASASEDTYIKLWNAQTGQEIATLTNQATRVTSVAFHPSGQQLASADSTGKIRIWNLDGATTRASSRRPIIWAAHADEISCLVFSPDASGHWLASAGLDRKVKLWESTTGRELGVLPPLRDDSGAKTARGHLGPVKSLAFSPDGKLLASAGGPGARAGEVIVWDPATGDERYTFTGLNDRMVSVTFNKNGHLAAACNDGTLRIWTKPRPDLPFAGEPLLLRADAQGVYALAYSGNGQHLASAGLDGRIRLWNNNGGQETLTLPASPNSECVAFSKDSQWLAAAVGDRGQPGKVMLWALKNPDQPLAPLAHPGAVRSVAFHPDGKLLATGCEDYQVRLFDLQEGSQPLVLAKRDKKGHSRTVTCVAFSPDGKYLATASDDETIILWNVEKRTFEKELLGHTDGVEAVAFSPDGKSLASVGADRKVLLWDLATGKPDILGEHKSWTRAVAFSPDGKLVASGSDDKQVRIWAVQTRAEPRKLEGSAGGVLTVTFHPDGKRLVSSGTDKVVRLWDLITGQEILEMAGSTGSIKCVTFSRDGRWLAAAGYHAVLRLWEAPRGQ